MFIRSERLFLRPAWPEDGAEIGTLLANGTVMSNIPGEHLAAASWAHDRVHDGILLPTFCMTLPGIAGARLIGAIGLGKELGKDGAEAALGYWIAAREWGHGYAAEAARAVLRLAGSLGHRRVLARHAADNAGAEQVFTNAGFQRTGASVGEDATYAAMLA